MKDSLGGSFLLIIVITFITIVIMLFMSTLTYSKAYRVKNRIIEIIEKYGDYNTDAKNEIAADLSAIGYDSVLSNCGSGSNVEKHIKELYPDSYVGAYPVNLVTSGSHNYCVFEINSTGDKVSNGKYYVVVTFTRFHFPVIGNALTFPVYGETKILGKDYNY